MNIVSGPIWSSGEPLVDFHYFGAVQIFSGESEAPFTTMRAFPVATRVPSGAIKTIAPRE
jgi:hypothetical protein